jgi:hypothetical protein
MLEQKKKKKKKKKLYMQSENSLARALPHTHGDSPDSANRGEHSSATLVFF